MRIGKQTGKEYILLMLLAVTAMALVACGAEEGEETAEPLGEEFEVTPFLEDTPMLEETPTLEETPLTEGTPLAEETPMMEETAAVEETPMLEETPEEEATEPADDETPQTGATVTQTQMVRSDVLLDLTVAGQDGALLGEVRDILFDMQGNVHYLLLDLVLDEARTVAVTWDQVEVRHASALTPGAGVDDDAAVEDDETPEPAVGDDVDGDELVVVYLGQQTELETMTDLDEDILDAEGELVNLADLNLDATADVAEGQALQASEFDYDLINHNDDDLGEVEELVVNVAEGRVVYAIVDVGGFLGIGETTVALPWRELQFSEADEAFIVNADEDTLTDAPTVDFDEWDNGVAPDVDWGAEVEEFWNSIGGSS